MKRRNGSKSNKKKKIILFSSLLFVIVIIVLALLYYFYIYKKGIDYKTKLVIEVGDSIPTVESYVNSDDLDRVGKEITWKDMDTLEDKVYKSGEYEGTISYRDESIIVKLVVKDTKSPVISGVRDFEMVAFESEPDLLEDITASDNSKENIKLEIVGEYDTEKAGTYELYYYAKDSNDNEVKEPFKLVVKENTNIKFSKSNKGYTIKNYYGITYIGDVIIANKTYSLPSNYVPSNLVTINGYIRVVDYVRDAFNELKSDATSLGLNIYASSGYRSYSDQNYIYNNYVSMDGKDNADTYSARAGYSEHQTGLAIDLNTVDSSFDGTNESNWVKDNCYKYGFVIRYPKGKDNITGYMYEPWHIRYVGKDLAKKLYNNGDWITFEEYYGINSKYS